MTIGIKSPLFYILRHRKPELPEANNENLGLRVIAVVGVTIIISIDYLSS